MKAEPSHKWKSCTFCDLHAATIWRSSVTLVTSLTCLIYVNNCLTTSSCLSHLYVDSLWGSKAPNKSASLCHPARVWSTPSRCWLACIQELQMDFNMSLWGKNTIMVINLQESYNELKTLHKCFLDYLSLGITYAMISSMTADNWMLAILLQVEVLTLRRKWSM